MAFYLRSKAMVNYSVPNSDAENRQLSSSSV